MKRIKSCDAFGLALIKQNPNRNSREVQKIIKSLQPDVQPIAERILKKFEK